MGAEAAFANPERRARRRRRLRLGGAAGAISVAVHFVFAALLVAFRPSGHSAIVDRGPVSVELVAPLEWPYHRPSVKADSSPLSPPARPAPVGRPPARGARPGSSSVIATSPTTGTLSGAQGAPEASPGLILRRSVVGCAYARSATLDEVEREACRQWFARGASSATYTMGIPANKHEYYEALAASEEAMARNPLGGHGPAIVCGKGVGLKIPGLPCHIVPPQSPWTPEVDVPPP